MANSRASFTRVTLFVPGTPFSAAAWQSALRGSGLELVDGELVGHSLGRVPCEWIGNDGSFGAAFALGTVPAEGVRAIDRAAGALVLYFPVDLREGRTGIVSIIERLRDAGALAVRCEQSKLGWDVSRWIELLSSPDPRQWYRAAVSFLVDDDVLQSCGMHAFSLPDVHAGDAPAMQAWCTALNLYQVEEDPVILAGQTFAPDADTSRRVLVRWPDTGYPAGHPCHNPYGVWHVGQPGGVARPLGALLPVFMPALHPVLLALAAKEGPLTEGRVLQARDEAVCMMMAPRDAQALERSRGYWDLDPELVWEQWQLVREPGGDAA